MTIQTTRVRPWFLQVRKGPISRPRQVANTRPYTTRAQLSPPHSRLSSPLAELTAHLVLNAWLRRSASVTHQNQGCPCWYARAPLAACSSARVIAARGSQREGQALNLKGKGLLMRANMKPCNGQTQRILTATPLAACGTRCGDIQRARDEAITPGHTGLRP